MTPAFAANPYAPPASGNTPASPTPIASVLTPNPADRYELFRSIVEPDSINQRCPVSPQTVFTPFVTLWLLIVQRLNGGSTLNDAVSYLLFNFPDKELPDCKRVLEGNLSANTAGYSRARRRLPRDLVSLLADQVFDSLCRAALPTFGSRRVLLLDGSTFSLQPTPELRVAYPPSSNQYGSSHWPVLLALVCHDLDSGLVCRPEYGPMYGEDKVSESTLVCQLVHRLPSHSVLLADANFGIFIVAWHARQKHHDVVFRLTQTRFESYKQGATAVGPGRWKFRWEPSADERKKYGAEVLAEAQVDGYLVEVVVQTANGEETLYLFTTLEDGSIEELGALYCRRWSVETDIEAGKETLGLGAVQGKSPEMVEKELVLATVAYNLVVQVRRLAARQAGVEPRKLSFAGTQSLLKAFEASLGAGNLSEEELQKRFERLLRACGQRRVPERPGRQYPREVIPRRRRYPERKRGAVDPTAPPGTSPFDRPSSKTETPEAVG